MRLFTAIDLPADTASRLEELQAKLRPAARLRWSRVENLHITTKFIGEWPSDRLDEMVAALGAIPSVGAIEIALRGLGYFPNPHQPRVFWVGVEAGEPLARLAKLTGDATAPLGVPREDRPFHPHLTLARLNPRADPPGAVGALRRAVASVVEPDCGAFSAQEWHLYLSEPGGGVSRYTRIETFALQ